MHSNSWPKLKMEVHFKQISMLVKPCENTYNIFTLVSWIFQLQRKYYLALRPYMVLLLNFDGLRWSLVLLTWSLMIFNMYFDCLNCFLCSVNWSFDGPYWMVLNVIKMVFWLSKLDSWWSKLFLYDLKLNFPSFSNMTRDCEICFGYSMENKLLMVQRGLLMLWEVFFMVFDDNILVTFQLSWYVVSITVMLFRVYLFIAVTLSH